jgi:uncharacterized protein (DUF849 family)
MKTQKPKKETARCALVEEAVRILRENGAEPASPAETRKALTELP